MALVENLTATQSNRHVPTVIFRWTGGSKYRYKIDDGSWVEWIFTTSGRGAISANWGEKITFEVHEDIEGGTQSESVEFTLPLFAPPTGLRLDPSTTSVSQATLSWDDPDYDDITGYKLYLTTYTYTIATDTTTSSTEEKDVTGFSKVINSVPSTSTVTRHLEIEVAATSDDGVGAKSDFLHHGTPKNFKVYRHINGIKLVFDDTPNKTTRYKYKVGATGDETSFNPSSSNGKLSFLIRREPTDSTSTYYVVYTSRFTKKGEVSSVALTDVDSADDDLTIYLDDIDAQQREYFDKHGRFFQKLESTVPTDNSSTTPDHTDPDDQEFTGDSTHDFTKKVPFSVRIDEWLEEDVAYYKVTVKLSHDRVYTKTVQKRVTIGVDGDTHSDFVHSEWDTIL